MKTLNINFLLCFAAIVLVSEASDLTAFERLMQFTVDLDELKNGCVKSPEILMSKLPWSIQVCIHAADDDDIAELRTVDVTLTSPFNKKHSDLIGEAQATFKLLPHQDQNNTPIVRNMTKCKFSSHNPSYKFTSFVEWNKLVNVYSADNEATFEVELSISPPIRKIKLDTVSANLFVTVDTVHYLDSHTSLSSTIVLRGIRWLVEVKKGYDRFLTVNLVANKDDVDLNWTWEVTAVFKLISANDAKSKTRTETFEFDWRNLRRGIEYFLEWGEFVDSESKYVENGAAILYVEINVPPPKPLWNI